MERQLTEWEKMFANPITDKRLVSRSHKEHIQVNNKKEIIQIKPQAKDIVIYLYKICKVQSPHEKIYILSHQQNANQNRNEIPFYTHWDGCNNNDHSNNNDHLNNDNNNVTDNNVLGRMWRNSSPHTLPVGMWNGAVSIKSTLSVPQKAKHRITIYPSNYSARKINEY